MVTAVFCFAFCHGKGLREVEVNQQLKDLGEKNVIDAPPYLETIQLPTDIHAHSPNSLLSRFDSGTRRAWELLMF